MARGQADKCISPCLLVIKLKADIDAPGIQSQIAGS
jgi:hypothetical protein